MGASIMYRPVDPKADRTLDVGAPSSFIEAMERVFGPHPWRLDHASVDTINGMAAVYGEARDNPYHQIVDKICELGAIEVWPEW